MRLIHVHVLLHTHTKKTGKMRPWDAEKKFRLVTKPGLDGPTYDSSGHVYTKELSNIVHLSTMRTLESDTDWGLTPR